MRRLRSQAKPASNNRRPIVVSLTPRHSGNIVCRNATVTIAFPRCFKTRFVSARSIAPVVSRGRPPRDILATSPSHFKPPLSSHSWMQYRAPCCVNLLPSGLWIFFAMSSRVVQVCCGIRKHRRTHFGAPTCFRARSLTHTLPCAPRNWNGIVKAETKLQTQGFLFPLEGFRPNAYRRPRHANTVSISQKIVENCRWCELPSLHAWSAAS